MAAKKYSEEDFLSEDDMNAIDEAIADFKAGRTVNLKLEN